jgi:hypothetical protein
VSTLCSLDPRDREEILRRLVELAERLRRELAVEAVYVFGSFARGDEHEGSDIDLLVVGDLPGRVFDQIGEVLRRTDLPVEPVVLRASVLERRRRDGHPFFARVLEGALRLA